MASNGKQKGHGAADRRCPIFLDRVARMNKTRKENNYKYFAPPIQPRGRPTCTATTEIRVRPQGYNGDSPWQEGARGKLGRGNKAYGKRKNRSNHGVVNGRKTWTLLVTTVCPSFIWPICPSLSAHLLSGPSFIQIFIHDLFNP